MSATGLQMGGERRESAEKSMEAGMIPPVLPFSSCEFCVIFDG